MRYSAFKQWLINCFTGLLLLGTLPAAGQFALRITYVDKDSTFNPAVLQLQTDFPGQLQCIQYIDKLPALLTAKGFPTASVDSIFPFTDYIQIHLYIGRSYRWVRLQTDSVEPRALEEGGYFERNFSGKPLDVTALQALQRRMLAWYEKTGYPFAAVSLQEPRVNGDSISARLSVSKGPLYHIDSIRVSGKAKISSYFLQRYLSILNGSVYNRDKLDKVSRRLLELPYLQETAAPDLTLLGSGSVLNLYLAPRRSSQVNFLVGFLPANSTNNKTQVTGDVKLDLKNAFGTGETILFNWQQLQLQSPRLNLGYQKPFIFRTALGIDFSFELFKKDSAFLQLNAQLGLQYLLGNNQSGKLFVQNQRTILLASGADTNAVKNSRTLPPNIDVSTIAVGVDYEWFNTNYRRNPRKGNDLRLVVSAGTKKISKSDEILNLKAPGFNFASLYDSVKLRSYQLRVKFAGAHYFPLSRQSTFKLGVNAGLFSSQSIFRNELFQIGGYRLLRGFDEESIYATQYGVATAEYRNIFNLNSYLFAFIDGGWARNRYQAVNISNTFVSAGLGFALETKLGLLNVAFAAGKRNDLPFNLRRATKIHFGYVNYF